MGEFQIAKDYIAIGWGQRISGLSWVKHSGSGIHLMLCHREETVMELSGYSLKSFVLSVGDSCPAVVRFRA